MEGNTYSLLDTERLIRFGKENSGKVRKDAVMMLNHKEAIEYIVNNIDEISVSKKDLFNIHALLADDLLAEFSMLGRLRRFPVQISSSKYMPLDNPYVIEENFNIFVHKVSDIADPFEQSFFLLVHIPYLQAFENINK